MTNVLYSIICLLKYYLLYLSCRLVFITCYRLCTITEANSKLYAVLYEQNCAIFKRESIELLSNQILEYQTNNSEKNKSTLSARMNTLDFNECEFD